MIEYLFSYGLNRTLMVYNHEPYNDSIPAIRINLCHEDWVTGDLTASFQQLKAQESRSNPVIFERLL